MKRLALVLTLALWTIVLATACGGGSKSDTPVDGDTTVDGDPDSDGDTNQESEAIADGDTNMDNDSENEAESDAEQDTNPDGDTTESAEETEAPLDGDLEVELAGFCSASGVPCDESVPCATATVEVQGFCSSSALSNNHVCLYAPIHPLTATFSCGANTLNTCTDNIDCSLGIGCGSIGPEWCAPGAPGTQGVCLSVNTLSGGSTPCTLNSQCSQTLSNVCVICGNGSLDSAQEECEDSNVKDGDGCSARCQFEGNCYDSMSGPTGFGCVSDADCTGCMGSCSCHMTI